MNVSQCLQKVKHLFKRASSLLMLFQRTPAAQLLVPAEFNLVSSAALLDTTSKLAIATVAGLSAYDSVAGATTVDVLPASLQGCSFVSSSSTLNVVAGTPMSASFQMLGGIAPPKSWQVVGTMPAGLSMPNAEGNINTLLGTTTNVGNWTVSVRAYEGVNFTDDYIAKSITIKVNAPDVATIITNPASESINSGLSTTLTVVAVGQAPLTYQWYQGNAGVTTTPVGTNSASFTTPVLTSTTRYWVKVTNPANQPGSNSDTAVVTVLQPAAIFTQPESVTIFTSETATLQVTATGDAPLFYQWYQGSSGNTSTPVGTNSRLFTTPSLTATTSYWVKVSNNANVPGVFSNTVTVTVETPSDPTILTPETLPPARTNIAYTTTIRAVGGRQPYVWTILEGDLPEGLSLSEAGVISGTSTSVGTATINVQVMDGDEKVHTRVFSMEISDLDIVTSTLPNGTHGKPYTTTLAAIGGGEPYEWSLEGTPPSGITMSTEGVLSGIPGAAGDLNLTIKVIDANSFAVTKDLVLHADPSDLSIVTTTLPTAVKGMPYSATLAASGGDGTYTWHILSGPLPAGVIASTSGVFSGTPTAAGGATITVQVTDGGGVVVSKAVSITFSEKAVKPIMNTVTFPVISVGTTFNHQVTAQYHPKTFTIAGLPKGLKALPSGAISGTPDVAGIFNVQIKATNSAGSSTIVTSRLTVKALPKSWIGTFGGTIARHSTANRNLGGQFSLTITTTGIYSLKITAALPGTKVAQGGLAITSRTGRVAASAPFIITIPDFAGAVVNLNIDSESGDVIGTVGSAVVTGWRSTWNTVTNPAEHLAGYYSMALDVVDSGNNLNPIPYGSGFATFTISSGGVCTITGKAADGENITSAGFISKGGDVWLCSALNKGLGSIQGSPKLHEDPQGLFAGNVIEGEENGREVTWLRPATTSTLYPDGFGPLPVRVEGGYLAASNKGFVILGLPDEGTTQLTFSDGGLDLSDTDPNILFTYTDDNKIVPPPASTNPGKVTVTLSATTGALAGSFSLLEPSGFARNKVPFAGQIVRKADGSVRAAGYFLLPQIPASGQKPTAAPVLSGGVQIRNGSPG